MELDLDLGPEVNLNILSYYCTLILMFLCKWYNENESETES